MFENTGESGVGVVQLSFVPSDAALALLRAAAGTYATGGEVVFDEKDAAQFALAWTVKRADESSPPVHHLATLARPFGVPPLFEFPVWFFQVFKSGDLCVSE